MKPNIINSSARFLFFSPNHFVVLFCFGGGNTLGEPDEWSIYYVYTSRHYLPRPKNLSAVQFRRAEGSEMQRVTNHL